MNEDNAKLLENTKLAIDNFNDGYLEADLGYKFRTKDFLSLIFLYKYQVDTKNPDILGRNNKNTFFNEVQSPIEKIKEQIRLDLKDMNFIIQGASSLSRFVVRAANRKILKDNRFSKTIDKIPNNAADFGSGFLKVWKVNGELKMKSVGPYSIIFDQYNFSKGKKIERFTRTRRDIINDEKYDQDARTQLKNQTTEDKMDETLVLYQTVQDFFDGSQRIGVVDTEHDLVYYNYQTKKGKKNKIISYYKYDYEEREGFPDALGVGCYEKVFNKIVQSKVNRERMDEVLNIASKLPFQKEIENERDNYVGKQVQKLDTGVILGHKGKPITELNTGGIKQVNILSARIAEISNTLGNDLNMSEALIGKTLPSGTSAALGNLLTENASSVFKDKQEDYAKFLDDVYVTDVIPYMLSVFNSEEDLRKHLTPNDIKFIERVVINYEVAMRQVNAAINDEPFDEPLARQEVKNKIKKSGKLISGELLDQLREEVDGIETFITGENFSKPQAVAFLREIRNTYATNPALLNDPFYIEALRKEAELDSGMSPLEIDLLLSEIPKIQEEAAVAQ